MSVVFQVTDRSRSSQARIGRLMTSHGVVETPVFMPVGSKAAVKTLTPDELKRIGAAMVLANTYHLYLRPGAGLIEELGGLHTFMGWDGPILTDSGGYQVFSLSRIFKATDLGIDFASHIDGSRHFLSPEDVVDIQVALGSDIAMVLDEVPPFPADKEHVKRTVNRTLNWAKRSKAHYHSLMNDSASHTALFGIVQGGVYPELRRESALKTVEIGFPGYGIGGLSVGEPRDVMLEVLAGVIEHLPDEAPRYLMGVGDPEGITAAIELGVDMFDSALPTRIARNGTVFVRGGHLNIMNASLAKDARPLDEHCGCYTCERFSRAYLRHLYQTRETLALRLLTWHNLYFLCRLIDGVKAGVRKVSP